MGTREGWNESLGKHVHLNYLGVDIFSYFNLPLNSLRTHSRSKLITSDGQRGQTDFVCFHVIERKFVHTHEVLFGS